MIAKGRIEYRWWLCRGLGIVQVRQCTKYNSGTYVGDPSSPFFSGQVHRTLFLYLCLCSCRVSRNSKERVGGLRRDRSGYNLTPSVEPPARSG
jgi:hypothetical protein